MIGFQFQSPNLLPHRFLTSMYLPHFFNNVATDRTGPFHVIEGRQLSKHYICLFNCLPFRVVQLSVSQLFSEIFISITEKIIAAVDLFHPCFLIMAAGSWFREKKYAEIPLRFMYGSWRSNKPRKECSGE